MQHLKKLRFLVFLFLVALLSSCATVQPLEIISIDKVKVDQIKKGNIDLQLAVSVKNPNKFNVKVKDLAFKVNLNKLNLGDIAYNKKVKLKGSQTTMVDLTVTTSVAKVLMQAPTAFLSMKKDKPMPLLLDGSFKAGTWGVYKPFQVSYEDEVQLNGDFSF